MEYKNLGRSGLQVSAVGIGCNNFGMRIDHDQSIAVVRAAVDEGVVALQEAGADVILVNPQYSPRTETMISVPPYLDNMRVVAQQHDVPLFDRFAIMRHWAESGEFDLFSTFHGVELAKRVHNCLGRALSQFVIGAAHLNPAQQN